MESVPFDKMKSGTNLIYSLALPLSFFYSNLGSICTPYRSHSKKLYKWATSHEDAVRMNSTERERESIGVICHSKVFCPFGEKGSTSHLEKQKEEKKKSLILVGETGKMEDPLFLVTTAILGPRPKVQTKYWCSWKTWKAGRKPGICQ